MITAVSKSESRLLL